jgi:serine protease Do
MKKRMPVLFLIILLAGILMGLASNGWAQGDEETAHDHMVRVWMDGGSFLGVQLEEVTAEQVKRLGLPEERGALITDVVSDSPASKAGLQKDDVIVRWNGVPVESAMQFRRQIHETPAGRAVRLGIIRNGRENEIQVTLGNRSEHAKEFKLEMTKEAMEAARQAMEKAHEALKNQDWGNFMVLSRRGRMGVTLQHLTPQLADYFGLKDRSGVLITSVREGSPASQAGLKAGDVILAVDGQKVDDPGAIMRLIAKKEEGPVELQVMRDRREMSLTVTLEKLDRQEKSSYLLAPDVDIQIDPPAWPDLPDVPLLPRVGAPTPPPLFLPMPQTPALPLEPVRPRQGPAGVI